MLELLAAAPGIDILELFSIKTIELFTKKGSKDTILTNIDHILTSRLLDEG